MATLTNAEMQRNMELWYFSQVYDPTNYELLVGSPLSGIDLDEYVVDIEIRPGCPKYSGVHRLRTIAELVASAEPQPDIITGD